MEECRSTKLRHKEWRRIAKKERRRRIRQALARERDGNEERLRAALENNMEYLNFREEEEKRRKEKEAKEREEHAERERIWLEEEMRAQQKWHVLQEQIVKEEQKKLEQEMKIREEFEAKSAVLLRIKEEEKKKREEQLRQQEQLQKDIDDYIDNGVQTPEALREVFDNQPSKKLCPFFTKTGACRYGNACSRNHRKIFLSKVILIPGFYSHFSLEKNSAEYDTDVALEFENSETWRHFCEFYEDVVNELESFGRIRTFKCCCNKEIHLRGNLYVEYYTEREAARASRNLKGRWYGGKRLNCEFVNLTSWRAAVCGITKCPKGSKYCNFLHTFRNPRNKYEIKSPPRWAKSKSQDSNNSKRSEYRNKSNWEDSVRDNGVKDRDWRWSESPETELDHRSKDSEMKRSHSTERKQSQRSAHNIRQRKDARSRVRSSKKKTTSKKSQLNRKRAHDNKDRNKEETSDDCSPKKSKRKSQKKMESGQKRKVTREKHSRISEET